MKSNLLKAVLPIFILLLLMSSSCRHKPAEVLNEDKMTEVLTDIQLAEAYYNTNPGSSRNNHEELIASVIKKHGISKAQYDSTILYYGRNLDEYYNLYDKVSSKLKKRSGQTFPELLETGNDIWPYYRHSIISPVQTTDGLIFTMPTEEINPGDALEWKMRLSSVEGVEAVIGVEYENGNSSLFKKSAAGNKALKINLQTDTAQTPKRIFGSISAPASSMPIWVDSIRLIRTDFDSTLYYKIKTQHNHNLPKPRPIKQQEKDSI